MPRVTANNLDIEVERYGDTSKPPVLLIMGLATQLVHWPPALIDSLVEAGYHVIAFDNRDIGLSEKFEHKHAPPPAMVLLSSIVGLSWALAPYDLSDMAADTIGVLDALDIESAHLLGVSMGGMIGQIVAAKYGDRIRSFTSIMSSTNNRRLPRADADIVRKIVEARATAVSRQEMVERSLGVLEMIGTPDSGRDPDATRQLIADSIERCSYPEGVRRQIAAIIASGDLRRWARRIVAPTLVMHGDLDRLAHCEGSVDIARSIPGARLEIIEGMGHDLPPRFLGRLIGHTVEHLHTAEASRD